MRKRKDTKPVAGRSVAKSSAGDGNGNGGGNNTTASGLDLQAIRELARIAGEFGLTEVEADPSGHIRISRRGSVSSADGPDVTSLSRSSGPTIALAPPAPVEGASEPGTFINSPFVGTFYSAPSPDAAAFAEVGQRVKKGQVVCIVEAMKLMNEIEAEADGKVAEIMVKNGEHVEYGQGLIRLTPL
ncbi:MAG: acetyl-CoA carboxylase biotin carboxyl carrier protein [Deltaproteobacteria bacterium]|nr:acetyl-CoA carboxylase biotin carboxyl carrier protein [Deltaproteobacteria bacterium]